MQRLHTGGVATIAALLAVHGPGRVRAPQVIRLTLTGAAAGPAALRVPADADFILIVANDGAAPVAFESRELGVGRIVPARRETTLRIGPLTPGRYSFMDEFHVATRGVLVAVPGGTGP